MALVALSTLSPQLSTLFAQGTAFTYQGRLNDGVSPANGSYDLRFALFDAASAGTQQGNYVTNSATSVSNGLFTVALDFGNQFPGAGRWLEIGVQTNGGGTFTTLNPRQPLTSTPYAVQSANAATAASASSVSAANITGTLTAAQIPNLDANKLVSGTLDNARLSTNVALRAGGNAFSGNQTVTTGYVGIGTTLPERLLHVGDIGVVGSEAMIRLASRGGSAGRVWDFGIPQTGDFGGGYNFIVHDTGLPYPAQLLVQVDTGNVGIGTTNPLARLDVNGAVRATQFLGDGGALTNLNGWKINGNSGTTPGVNFLGTTDNQPLDFRANNQRVLRLETVSDGFNSYANVIGGSSANSIGTGSHGSVIGGGGSTFSRNTIWTNSGHSVIGGGQANNLGPTAGSSIIAGGQANTITNGSYWGAILGGYLNRIGQDTTYNTMGGGALNAAANFSYAAVIGGGISNSVAGIYSIVPGGELNSAGSYGFAAGRRAKASHFGSFVWADSVDADFASTANNQFNVRANGGVRFITGGAGLQVDGTNVLAGTVPASVLTGTIADARLSTNVALRTAGNTFSGNQVVTNGNVAIGTNNPGSNNLQINPTFHPAIGYGLQVNKAAFGANIQINRAALESGIALVVDNSGAGDTNTTLLLVRNNVAATSQTLLKVRADGNVGIGTDTPTNKLHVAGGITCTALTQTSDCNAKENFAPVSAQDVLNKVATLPITTWNFKDMKDGRHMGPMAQDFYAAFGLGGGNTTITSIDPDGVALAAIQGLNQKLEQKLEQKETEISALRHTVNELKELVHAMNQKLKGGAK